MFDPVVGGIVGGGTKGSGTAGAGGGGGVDFRIRATTAEYLAGMARGEVVAGDAVVAGRAARFLAVYAEHVVMAVAQRPLRTMRAVFPDVA